ncbi:TIGR03618 family F420-dependent PPOX class oxidoreductase [Streptomyces iranensis]|uniref:ATP binding protein n=1 Tax=Streptomyces iranensis TaxID=576784 RepID=A0A061A281_9ACTN|nr:TIGR03618 family F420-dependent PPOX class oxidoreductase [Streptomyces iranensis]MBP2060458.1 PPOX class probable F420-dependent enzyme [Streptomyces iranensis]CDR16388.1 ATP binding protein [Streptomyces iranensis]
MTDLQEVDRIAAADHHLAVVSTTRADGSVQASVVNAGIVGHPVSGDQVVAFVTYGPAKLAHLRARPRATVVFRAGWNWAAVEGRTETAGPDDPFPGIDPERLRLLLREIFTAAGGTHDDWAAYDRVMAEQRRAAVFVHPERVYGN